MRSPSVQQHDVARNQLLGQDALFLTIAQHARVVRDQLLQRLGRLLGAELLPEAERAVDHIDHPDGHAELGHLGHEGCDAAHPQHDRHEVGEVGQQLGEQRLALDLGDHVRAVALQPLGHLGCRQPIRARVQCAIHLRNWQAMNRHSRPGCVIYSDHLVPHFDSPQRVPTFVGPPCLSPIAIPSRTLRTKREPATWFVQRALEQLTIVRSDR